MKKIAVFSAAGLVLILALSLLVSCKGKEETSTASAGSGSKKVLKYWFPFGGDSGAWDEWCGAEFEKDNGEYVFESTFVPDGSGVRNGKLMAAINAGDVPDVVISDSYNEAYSMATQGAFEPLDAALAEIGFDVSKINQLVAPLMKWRGVTYIYPHNTNNIMLYYRTDLFEEAGLDPNNPPKTIAELDALAEKLTVRNGNDVSRYGFIPWLDEGDTPATWTWQFQADVYDEANNKVTLSNQAVARVYEWYRSYAQKNDPERMRAFTASLGAIFSPDHAFMQGKVAMTAQGNWYAEAIRLYAPDLKYAVAPLPALDASKYGGTVYSANIMFCPLGAKEIVGAMKFAEYRQTAKIMEDNVKVWRVVGVYRDLLNGLSLVQQNDPVYKVCVDSTFNSNSGLWVLSPAAAELYDKLHSFTDTAIYSKNDIMAGLRDIETSIQREVDQMLAD